jgi:hypothetical protein
MARHIFREQALPIFRVCSVRSAHLRVDGVCYLDRMIAQVFQAQPIQLNIVLDGADRQPRADEADNHFERSGRKRAEGAPFNALSGHVCLE